MVFGVVVAPLVGCAPAVEEPAGSDGPRWSTQVESTPAPAAEWTPSDTVAIEGTFVTVLPDLDGDGADDVLSAVVEVIPGGPSVYDPVRVTRLAVAPDVTAGSPPRYLGATVYRSDDLDGTWIGLSSARPAGDLSGDGLEDLWVTGQDYQTYLVPGPFTSTEDDVLSRAEGPGARWAVGPLDADGDGFDDAVGLVPGGEYPSDPSLVVCAGPVPDLSASSCPSRALDGWAVGGFLSDHGDLDGDGVPEIALTSAVALLAVSGDDLDGDPYLAEAGGGAWLHLADLDGDGSLDAVWQAQAVVHVPVNVDYGPIARGASLSAEATVDLTYPLGVGEAALPASYGGALAREDGAASVVLGSGTPPGHRLFDLSGPGAYAVEDGVGLAGSGAGVVADLDGDGRDDWVTAGATPTGGLLVFSGATLP